MHVSYQCKRCMAPVHQHWRHASLALFHQVDSKLLNADWMKTHLQEWVMSMQCTHGYTVYEKRMYVCLYWLWSTDYVQMCEILWNKYSFIHSLAILVDSTEKSYMTSIKQTICHPNSRENYCTRNGFGAGNITGNAASCMVCNFGKRYLPLFYRLVPPVDMVLNARLTFLPTDFDQISQ